MSSTNKTSLGLNMWEASDKPVRQDFINDNTIIDKQITKLNSDLTATASNLKGQITTLIDDLDIHLLRGATGWTAIQAGDPSSNIKYRLQLNVGGTLVFYQSTDGGTTWTGKTVANYNNL